MFDKESSPASAICRSTGYRSTAFGTFPFALRRRLAASRLLVLAINITSASGRLISAASSDDRAVQHSISQDAAKLDMLSEKQPSGRFVSVEEIAALTRFLCSPSGRKHHLERASQRMGVDRSAAIT